MKYTIDRFEGDFAIIEDDNMITATVSRSLIDINAKEGSRVIYNGEVYELINNINDISRIKNKFNKLKKN